MEMNKFHPLPIALEAAVPLRIIEIKQAGYICSDYEKLVSDFADELGSHGDTLLYKSSKKGEAAQIFSKMAIVVACLAFQPGGITIFDLHFEASFK